MGGTSGSSSTTTNAGDPFGGFKGDGARRRREFVSRAASHSSHVVIFRRLSTPHDGHVRAWRAWQARPWGWRNYLAASINGFINWLEGG